MSLQIANTNALKDIARGMERELNLLRRDSLEVGLSKANTWAEFVDWSHLLKIAEVWRPLESRIRESLKLIRRSEPEGIETHRESLLTALRDLEAAMRPLNADAIADVTEKLRKPYPLAN